MKLTKAVGYDVGSQQEIDANFLLDKTQVLEIVNSFFDKMEYSERRKWIWENVKVGKLQAPRKRWFWGNCL